MKILKYLLVILGLILLLGNAFFAIEYFLCKSELSRIQKSFQAQEVNEKVLSFTKFFVSKVLDGESEISFDDRLQMENDVRDIKDQEIFTQWQKFTGAKTDQDVQHEVSGLFTLLLNKVSY
jgi:hypothetical protein